MKRSQHIRLVLLGGLSSAALAGGVPTTQGQTAALQGNVFTNDHKLPHSGHYHAPYRAWFALPYNHHDPQRGMYFHGGQWSPQPHESFTNISPPQPLALSAALAAMPKPPPSTTRSGFGSSSRSGFIGS